LGAINKLDIKKIEGKINLSGTELYMEKLQNEIRKSLREAEWDKLSEEEQQQQPMKMMKKD